MKQFIIIAFALALLPMFVSADLTTSITDYYTFDNTMNDSVDSDIATNSGTTSIAGKIAEARDFNAADPDYITLPDSPQNTTGVTYLMWINADAWDHGDFIIQDDIAGSNRAAYIQQINTNQLKFAIWDDGLGSWRSTTVTGFSTGTWYYLGIMKNNTGAYAIVNGEINATIYSGSFTRGTNTDVVTLGMHQNKINNPYDGIIDEVAMWNRGLTESEISLLYNNGTGCSYPFGACSTIANATVTATDAYNGSNLLNFTVTWNGTEYNTTSGTVTLPILENTTSLWNITVSANEYFTNHTVNVNLSTPYNAIMWPWTKIYAQDGQTNTTINNFTVTWNGTNYTTTTGLVKIPLYNVTESNVSISTNGIYNDDSSLLNATPYLQNYTFILYSDPSSVDVTIYDQKSRSIITQNITLVVSGNNYEETFYVLNGTEFVSNLTAGTYSFKFSGQNYTTQTYTISVGTNTYQTLNVFLATNTSAVTFTIVDFDSNAEIEGATITQQRLISNTWTTVASKISDITGRVQFQYVEDVKYRFITSMSGYTTKTFELDPVIFSSYTVRITRDVTQTDDNNFAGVVWSISPTSFASNNSYNLTFTITSPEGTLESYGLTASYPGDGPKTAIGTNAYGNTLTIPIYVNASNFQETINITLWYDTTTTENRSYSRHYLIEYNSTAGTWANIPATDYGLTTFEKVMIGIMAVILVGGFGFMFAGSLGGGLISLFMLGWMYVIGFLTLWMILPSILVGLVIIFWRSST